MIGLRSTSQNAKGVIVEGKYKPLSRIGLGASVSLVSELTNNMGQVHKVTAF